MLTSWVLRAIIMASAAAGVHIMPTNGTTAIDDSVDVALPDGNTISVFSSLEPLGSGAGTLPPYGISDHLFHATGNNQQNLTGNDIAYISCDSSAYPGYTSLLDVFETALGVNTTAIILYSLTASQCNISGLESDFGYIYSMPNQTMAQNLLDRMDDDFRLAATILASDSSRISNNGNATTGTTTTRPGYGTSPTTAVAMIILYSVTGIITALFLIVIITGAVRAHRHPERYGPRNITGRARQSRARGLARAMLDTIPIVKFDEQRRDEHKQGDVEMLDTADRSNDIEQQAEQVQESFPRKSTSSARSGIGAATNGLDGAPASPRSPVFQEEEAQGCSICTEDFEAGQDLRVLPCDHKFHPACIDPWLLNVSGTCPLCRIDLNPQRTNESQEGEHTGDEDELPPPINGYSGTSNRVSMRRSLLIGLGLDRGHSREQRMAVARDLRNQQENEGQDGQNVDEGRRRRLRERLGIRTRRRGQETAGIVPSEPLADVPETSERPSA